MKRPSKKPKIKKVSSFTGPSSAALQKEVRELREWKRRLGLLLEYTKNIGAHRELNSLLARLVDVAREILQAERCTVFLFDPIQNELWSRQATGDTEIRVPATKGIVGEALQKKHVINIPDAYADPRFNSDVDRITGFRTRSVLTGPMMNTKGEAVGVFQVLNKRDGVFSQDDEAILWVFSEQAATAVENAKLNEEIRAATKDTIFRLAAAAEYKDTDTKRHLERMSRYSQRIAEAMNMPEEWCQNLYLASPMHDIGKLGVPDAILRKPGRLDEREWVEMRKHPLYGADILGNSDNELLRMSERVARAHHEKWDGSGYPFGLKGEQIPLEARIVALADVFDALTSRRCYKPAFSMDESLNIINEGKGKHFDPAVVEAFHKTLPTIVQIMEKYAEPEPLKPADPTPSPTAA